ncbi:MAG: hypothetical protein IKF91_00960 [Bacilli bacterium]|nr:hypothetical protein [Bacilli bacterium]
MYLLFEIPDSVLIVIGIIIVLLIAIVTIIIKASSRKIKPIDEDERYDSDVDYTFTHDESDEVELTSEQIKAKEELQKVFNQMNADLEKQKSETSDIDEFEREQEENAIISYQELLAHADKLKKEADEYERIAEEKANTRINDTIDKKEARDKESIEEKKKAFRSSEIVSPIYGIQSNKNMVRQKKSSNNKKSGIIGKAYEQKRFEKEETQNLDFLNSLKEFRRKL